MHPSRKRLTDRVFRLFRMASAFGNRREVDFGGMPGELPDIERFLGAQLPEVYLSWLSQVSCLPGELTVFAGTDHETGIVGVNTRVKSSGMVPAGFFAFGELHDVGLLLFPGVPDRNFDLPIFTVESDPACELEQPGKWSDSFLQFLVRFSGERIASARDQIDLASDLHSELSRMMDDGPL